MVIYDHTYVAWQTLDLNWYRIAGPICVWWFVPELHQHPNAALAHSDAKASSQPSVGVAATLPIVEEVRANLLHAETAPAYPGKLLGRLEHNSHHTKTQEEKHLSQYNIKC